MTRHDTIRHQPPRHEAAATTEVLAPIEAVGRDFMMIDASSAVAIESTAMDPAVCDQYDTAQPPIVEIDAGKTRFVVFGQPDGQMKFAHARHIGSAPGGRNHYAVDAGSYKTLTEQPLLVGRSRRPDQHDETMSAKHFQLSLDESGRLVVADTGSLNGTSVRFGRLDTPVTARVLREIQSPDEVAADFQEQAFRVGTAELTDRLLQAYPEQMMPTRTVEAGGRRFYLTDIIGPDDRYPHLVMYTTAFVDGKGLQMVPRLLYKSTSDGGWRVSYGIEPGGRYQKETRIGSHYAQETKPIRHILEAIEAQQSIDDPTGALGDDVKSLFIELPGSDAQRVKTAEQEIAYYHDRNDSPELRDIRFLSPGHMTKQEKQHGMHQMGYESVSDYFRGLDTAFRGLPGLIPDFSIPPRVYRATHTLLGSITVEEFDTQFNGRPVTWSMAHDADGRVWVDNVVFADSSVSSYGTRAEVLDMGCITSKPLDYQEYLSLLNHDEKVALDHPKASRYLDVTPVLEQLLPVAFYRAIREVEPPVKESTMGADTRAKDTIDP